MYTVKTIKEILSENIKELEGYKLCYIDEISETYSDWDEDSKKIISSPGFTWDNKEITNRLRLKDYPNPDYIKGEQELYAFFTPLELEEQWGDDWNDAPYDCNAGVPYDHGDDHTKKVNIIQIPFWISTENNYVRYPLDYGFNTPFCVEDINLGAVPWIFIKSTGRGNDRNIVNAGCNPIEFCSIVNKWKS